MWPWAWATRTPLPLIEVVENIFKLSESCHIPGLASFGVTMDQITEEFIDEVVNEYSATCNPREIKREDVRPFIEGVPVNPCMLRPSTGGAVVQTHVHPARRWDGGPQSNRFDDRQQKGGQQTLPALFVVRKPPAVPEVPKSLSDEYVIKTPSATIEAV